MPETTTTTVNRNSEGQYQVTIPKALGDGFNLAGAKVEWKPKSGSSILMKVSEADE